MLIRKRVLTYSFPLILCFMNILLCCLSLFHLNINSPKDTIVFIDSSNGNRIPFVNLYMNNKSISASDGRGLLIYSSLEASKIDTISIEALGYYTKILTGGLSLDTIKLLPQSIPLSEKYSDGLSIKLLVYEIIESLKNNNSTSPYVLQGCQQEELLFNKSNVFNISNDFKAFCYPVYFKKQPDPFKFKYTKIQYHKDETFFSKFEQTPYARVRNLYPVNSIYELLILDIYQTFYHRGTYAFPFPVMESFLHFFSASIERKFVQNNDTIYLMKFYQKEDDFSKIINQIANSKPKNQNKESFFSSEVFGSGSNLFIYFSTNTKTILQYSFIYNSKTDISKHLSYSTVQYSFLNNFVYPTKASKWEIEISEFRDKPEKKFRIEHYNEAKIELSNQILSEKIIPKIESTSPKDKLW